jgi:hypothetical protein
MVWSLTGTSAIAAHLASGVCTLGATLAAWRWFRRLYPREVAFVMALALGVNWAWARTGSGIQSEPLYELLGQLAILAATSPRSGRGAASASVLGVLLGLCMLTRQIAVGIIGAVVVDLWLRGERRRAAIAGGVTSLLVLPWLIWMASVGTSHTQAGLLMGGNQGGVSGLASQMLFYLQRIPDQLIGPVVEIATVLRPLPFLEVVANFWAGLATAIVIAGWLALRRRPRRRLAALIPLFTIGLLLVWPYSEAGRFLIPLIPCLVIGAVRGLELLGRRASRAARRPVSARRLSCRAAWVVLLASLPYPAYAIVSGHARRSDPSHEAFDEACAFLRSPQARPGLVLSRHPGEVFLETGRQGLEVSTAERPGAANADAEAIARTIARYGVAYLLIDEERYINAPESPLRRFVVERPEAVRRVWSRERGRSSLALYEALRAR